MKVLMIGAGNMGATYAEGMAKSKLLNGRKLQLFDKSTSKLEEAEEKGIFDVFTKLEDCLPKADIVFLAVKPYHKEELFEEMRPMIHDGQMFVSLMAGVKLETIIEGLGVSKVVRTMPNLPAQIGLGMTSYTPSKEVSRLELLVVRNFLDMTGHSIHVESEKFIDASTGISGSGPAYVFYFMNAMLEAAKKMGFSNYDSRVLVSHTFEGAVQLFNESNITPKTWMDRVASKGGTTRAALDSMEENNVKELIENAAYAAFDRAVELGNE